MTDSNNDQPTLVRAISYGFLSYLALSFLGAVLVAMCVHLFQTTLGTTKENVDSLFQSQSFFIWVNTPGFFASIAGGYVCARYTVKKHYRNTLLLWIAIFLLGIISYNGTFERLFIIATTLAGVLIGAFYFSRRIHE